MLSPITLEFVKLEIDAFDKDNEAVETGLKQLLDEFPQNTKVSQILLKVVTINQLYHARVLDKDLLVLAQHIGEQKIDPLLEKGSSAAVERIWDSPCSRRYYSFATKFCSWHNRAAYPMHDGNVARALSEYRTVDSFASFTTNKLYDYEKLLGAVTAFRGHYGLESLDFKDIDKFLWREGDRIIKSSKETAGLAAT